ncbi:MAG: hypothetical protein LBT89_08215 [Planctomycetaceae bacterium]|jgi:nitrogenase molybdenum-iron protein NifN|nr:hypothetical protein [Planctomycetaceae bacterium]
MNNEHFSEPAFVSARNACKLCSPLGACFAMHGIEGCISLIHGSQGCATYIRRYGISHFREPIDIASSNFVEATAIFGGRNNLFRALDNVTQQYQPQVIGIASTCLSETIGDDVSMYLREYLSDAKNGCRPIIFYASTPSYRGTHIDGFHEAIYAAVCCMVQKNNNVTKTNRINLISNFVSVEDIRALHSILQSYQVPYTLLPDYSETFDGGTWEEYQKIPEGGTPVSGIAAMSEAAGTLYLGKALNPERNAAYYMSEHFHIPAEYVDLPIGIGNTDRFFDVLNGMTGSPMPDIWTKQRSRLIDAYFDGHKYCAGKRAILYGDEDFVVAMASFLDEIGVIPVIAATGAAGESFSRRIKESQKNIQQHLHTETKIMSDTDFATIMESAAELEADFALGSSKGFYLTRQLGIPLVRCGFPIHDRIGGHRILHLGYNGTLNLFERICNALMEAKQNAAPSGWTYI